MHDLSEEVMGVRLIHGECFVELAQLETGSFDMVLVDPPYGTTSAGWDVAPDWGELFAELWRLVKRNGVIAMFSQMPVASDIVQTQRKWFRYQWVWEKDTAVGFLNANKMPLRAHEVVLIFYRELPTYNAVQVPGQEGEPYKRYGSAVHTELYGKKGKGKDYVTADRVNLDGSRMPRDVVRVNRAQAGERIHPTQKPVELLKMLIEQYTQPGERVLDCYAGSGSTLKAAQITGRCAVGIERDDTYYRRAMEWLRDEEWTVGEDGEPRLQQLKFDLE